MGRRETAPQRMLKALREKPGSTAAELAAALAVSRQRAYELLNDLIRQSRATSAGPDLAIDRREFSATTRYWAIELPGGEPL